MSVEHDSDAGQHGSDRTGAGTHPPRSSRFVDSTGAMLRVRPFEPEDAEQLVSFYEDYPSRHRSMSLPPLARPQIEAWIEKLAERGRNLLVFDGDRLVGHAAYSPREGAEPELVVFVDDDYHGRGIGTELCRQVIAYAAADGHESIKLNVDVDNEAAVHVYESLGFYTVDHSGKRLLMRLDIDEDVKRDVCTTTP